MSYSSYHQYAPSSGSYRYFAHIDLPNGATLTGYACFYNDGSAANDLDFAIQRYYHDYSQSPVDRGSTVVGSTSSSGSAGLGWHNTFFTAETIRPWTGLTFYQDYFALDISSDTSFGGCVLFWSRQVSPAPASATFSDVPTGSPFFQFVEALASSGVTGGCGGGNYCPNDPITRGQMAVFLSAALGLHWPH